MFDAPGIGGLAGRWRLRLLAGAVLGGTLELSFALPHGIGSWDSVLC